MYPSDEFCLDSERREENRVADWSRGKVRWERLIRKFSDCSLDEDSRSLYGETKGRDAGRRKMSFSRRRG